MSEPVEPVRVGVLGARGRMGAEVSRAVEGADDLDLVAMVDEGDWLFSLADADTPRLHLLHARPAVWTRSITFLHNILSKHPEIHDKMRTSFRFLQDRQACKKVGASDN